MNATKRDYYEILSVSRDCDDAGLKSAYRKLALKYHPDRNPNDQDAEERFKEAAEAYSVLSDPQKRAAYDRYGHQGLQGMGGPGLRSVHVHRFRRHSRRSVRLWRSVWRRGGGVAADALARNAAKIFAMTSRCRSKTPSAG